jgi:NDP-sugar pyrophosphorylase family protein
MARLIPRKQIEEQQNITGSLTIGENLFLGNNANIGNSLFVSQSIFLGTETGSRNEITGSVFLTGSFVVDGLFQLGEQTLFSGTSSFSNQSVDTQRYAGILAKDFGANLPTLYVSSTDGDDTNDGRTIQYPLRTIKRAAALASPGYDGRYGFDTG